ncbi:FliH/SctL family protein [Anaerocolumna xylanovorans]|uniref:Flagellar assembly protein FliH n=1 Tax=Anaerocolumna xylanovorans DSM 12503 TaxID=1121345 RepID=A0A1M7YBH9_9FIRM|nr:FliH/SctL family protein [Anaerocolumna xylanovorans]SHO49878.1 flagellar assembly protein FliH [Anaerocolumna xylanovorans DSM 12503]
MRLLSNLIKSRYIAVSAEDKFVIDSNERSEEFRLINFANKPQVHVINKEIPESLEGFKPGIDAPVIETEETESEDELRSRLEDMISKAEEEAALIRKIAEEESKANCRRLYDDSTRKGYDDGFKKGMEEALKRKEEYEKLERELKKEYEEKTAALEPEFAGIMTALIEKVTGIAVEGKKGVITHLIHRAILHGDNSRFYHIKVSKEDYEEVTAYRPSLVEILNETIELDIAMDKNLSKNQCIIDTETGIVDCGLDTQLENLKKDIMLLSMDNL